jgi:putative restriction endonuclease
VANIDDFDRPIYKIISHNDSGASAGHQGGVVIPQVFDGYFPSPPAKTSVSTPSVYVDIRAILIVGNKQVGDVWTRYQHQSWGGSKTIERRITANLGALRDGSKADDALIIERSLEDPLLYRLTLLKQGTADYKALLAKVGTKRWGFYDPSNPPVADGDVDAAVKEQEQHQKKPLVLFDNNAVFTESRTKKIARSRAFQKLTTQFYSGKCAVCGRGFVAKNGRIEVEAAHIVPRGRLGADDARNGVALCRAHHWAFDHGLWGVGPDGMIKLAPAMMTKGSNGELTPFDGKKLQPPSDKSMSPDADALAWHLQNMFGK